MKKKKSKFGFSAVEFLGFIFAIAIVLIVIVPLIFDSMRDSQKDSFAKTANKILGSIKENYISENLICYTNGNDLGTSINNVGCKKVIVPFGNISGLKVNNELKTLLDDNTVSSFGKSELSGYVVIDILENNQNYSIAMTDSSNHFLISNNRCNLSVEELTKESVGFDDNGSCTSDKLVNNLNSTSQVLCKIKK